MATTFKRWGLDAEAAARWIARTKVIRPDIPIGYAVLVALARHDARQAFPRKPAWCWWCKTPKGALPRVQPGPPTGRDIDLRMCKRCLSRSNVPPCPVVAFAGHRRMRLRGSGPGETPGA